MSNADKATLSGSIVEEQTRLTIVDLSNACMVRAERIIELVDEGVLEPDQRDAREWCFSGTSLRRAHVALRLERDLGVNVAGAAVILDLMDEIERLRMQLRRER